MNSENRRPKYKNGFTIIELLVVIVILGLLASIIIVSVGNVRDKGRDARIRSAMDQVRKGAAVYQSYQNTYTGLDCTVTNPANMQSLCQDIDNQNGNNGGQPIFNSGANDYCAYVNLASSSAKWFCVSSAQGKAADTSINPNTTCTGANYNCP